MAYFEFPHTRTYDTDLGWLIHAFKDISAKLDEYLENAVITFADPITWDITEQYTALTCVIDSDGTAYLSKQPVPAGVDISNTDYWLPIFNYDDNINDLRDQIAYNARTSATTGAALQTGDLVFWNGVLYQVLVDMPAGTAFIEGTNISPYTVDEKINSLVSSINNVDSGLQQEILDRDAADVALGGRIDQEIIDRADADDLLDGRITALENMDLVITTPEEFGAVGDGVADDTQAFLDMVADAQATNKIMVLRNIYKITDTIYLFSGARVLQTSGHFIDSLTSSDSSTDKPYFGGQNISNVILDGLRFIGTSTAMTSVINYVAPVFFQNCGNITVRNCFIYGFSAERGITFDDSFNLKIYNNIIKYYKYCAIAVHTCSDVEIYNNQISEVSLTYPNTYAIGISYHGVWTSSSNCKRIRVHHNEIFYDESTANWESIDAHGGESIWITDNTIRGARIGIATMCELENRGFTLEYLTIARNYIHCDGAGSDWSACIVAGGDTVTIEDNYLERGGRAPAGSSSPTQNGGIVIYERLSYGVIRNNYFSGCGRCGISLLPHPNQFVKELLIENNTFLTIVNIDTIHYAIYAQDSRNVSAQIIGNKFEITNGILIHCGSQLYDIGFKFQDNYYYAAPTIDPMTTARPDVTTSPGNLNFGRNGDVCRVWAPTSGNPMWYVYTNAWVAH